MPSVFKHILDLPRSILLSYTLMLLLAGWLFYEYAARQPPGPRTSVAERLGWHHPGESGYLIGLFFTQDDCTSSGANLIKLDQILRTVPTATVVGVLIGDAQSQRELREVQEELDVTFEVVSLGIEQILPLMNSLGYTTSPFAVVWDDRGRIRTVAPLAGFRMPGELVGIAAAAAASGVD